MAPEIIPIREQLPNQELPYEWIKETGGSLIKSLSFGGDEVFSISREEKATGSAYLCTTSHFIGLDWIVPGKLAISVHPKMNKGGDDDGGEVEIDYLAMAKEALINEDIDPKNFEGLLHVQGEKPLIKIKEEDTGLILFVIVEFLAIIERLRHRGLKRSFYSREENFHFGMKGRILLAKSLQAARTPSGIDSLTCAVQRFDVDTPENQYLKRALRKTLSVLQRPAYAKEALLIEKTRLGLRAFEAVSDVYNAAPVRIKKMNPVFRDYVRALDLAEKIIAMESLGLGKTKDYVLVPPHWIDMAKLFELYVLKKFRESVGPGGHVDYQVPVHWQIADFLCAAPRIPELAYFVADAKYKKYDERSLEKADLRQVAGYARLEASLEKFAQWGRPPEEIDKIVPCVIIYPTVGGEEFALEKIEEVKGWRKIYKLAVSLPVKQGRSILEG